MVKANIEKKIKVEVEADVGRKTRVVGNGRRRSARNKDLPQILRFGVDPC